MPALSKVFRHHPPRRPSCSPWRSILDSNTYARRLVNTPPSGNTSALRSQAPLGPAVYLFALPLSSKTNALAATVFIDEFYASRFDCFL